MKQLAANVHPRATVAQCSIIFASPPRLFGLKSASKSDVGGATMSIARPIHLVALCAAFLFIGAIVLGAI
jgi:hypothetical protein